MSIARQRFEEVLVSLLQKIAGLPKQVLINNAALDTALMIFDIPDQGLRRSLTDQLLS